MANKVIHNIEEMKEQFKDEGPEEAEVIDFAIVLAGGAAYSRKEIWYNKDEYETPMWEITHCIDESFEILNDEDMLKQTNIGEAMENGTFIRINYDR